MRAMKPQRQAELRSGGEYRQLCCHSRAEQTGPVLQSRGHRIPKLRFSCHADVNSLSEWGLFDERHCSSKFEFFPVIANEQNLRLVVFGDVVTALKKCKELVTFEESLAWVSFRRNSPL